MYSTADMAAVAIDEFRRGLDGLTPDEAQYRPPKADGSAMNAVAWTVQHIGAHWWNVRLAALGKPLENRNPPRDGTPPAWEDALAVFNEAVQDLSWIVEASDGAMGRPMEELRGESTGTFLARAIFHSWFHIGEINAVRQLLGHSEIRFVGPNGARLKWLDSTAAR
jgi:hypothetical protein